MNASDLVSSVYVHHHKRMYSIFVVFIERISIGLCSKNKSKKNKIHLVSIINYIFICFSCLQFKQTMCTFTITSITHYRSLLFSFAPLNTFYKRFLQLPCILPIAEERERKRQKNKINNFDECHKKISKFVCNISSAGSINSMRKYW